VNLSLPRNEMWNGSSATPLTRLSNASGIWPAWKP
jgi:hypothetical protein